MNPLKKQVATLLFPLLLCWFTWGIQAKLYGKEPSSADRDLKKELSDPLLDDLKNLPLKKPGAAIEKSLLRRLEQELADGEDVGTGEQDPLIRISRRMQLAEELLQEKETRKETRKLQAAIAADLETLLKQMEKKGGGAGSQNANPPASQNKSAAGQQGTGEFRPGNATESTQRLETGKKEEGEKIEPREVLKKLWGQLPERVREELQNASPESFLPKYNQRIGDYYRNLAEMQKKRP